MRCEQVLPYIPGFAGGDLRADTRLVVAEHVGGCATCRGEAMRQSHVVAALASLSSHVVEPPAFLAEAVIESVNRHRERRRMVSALPIPPNEVARLVSDHREAIASAAGTALVAAGAAYALWRAVRRQRPAGQPATS